MTADDIKELTARIHSAIEHGDNWNAVWFVVFRDQMFNELPVVERQRYIEWAMAKIRESGADPWCVPNLWMSEEHRAAIEQEATRRARKAN